MRDDLSGKTVFVTGASRGIGAAFAERAASLSARVAVGYHAGADEAHAVVARLTATGATAIAVGVDVADESSVDAAFSAIEDSYGPVDVLVNNAGVHQAGRVHKLAPADWQSVIQTNLTGAYLCARRAVPNMLAASWGRIVNVSSVVGIKGFPADAAYAASKAGLLGMTRALALELAPQGITVNAIAPGFVDTDLTRGLSATTLQRIQDSIPLGRQGSADEVADALHFLMTTGYATGTTLVLDGGWTVA